MNITGKLKEIYDVLKNAVPSDRPRLLTRAYWAEFRQQFVKMGTAWQLFIAAHRDWRLAQRTRGSAPAPKSWPLAVGLVLGGVASFIIYGCFTGVLACRNDQPLLSILLLQDIPSGVETTWLPHWWAPPGLVTGLALCAMTGAFAVAIGIAVLANGFLKLMLSIQGLLLGYIITYALIVHLNLIQSAPLSGRLFIPQFSYILIINLLALGVSAILGGSGDERQKYDVLLLGMASIITSKILSINFGTSTVWFDGILFYASTFVGTFIAEHILLPFKIFLGRMTGGKEILVAFDSERASSWATVLRSWKHRDSSEIFVVRLLAGATLITPIWIGLMYFTFVKMVEYFF